jgi:tetratricopeptide (TPR) repeat protein
MGKVLKSGGVEDERRALKAQQTVVATIRSEPGSIGSQSLVGSVMGTPAYMPPEQAMGEIDNMDERSDVFSLGAILAEILTGQPPYPGTDPSIIQQAAQGELGPCRERIAECDADEDLKKIALACLVAAPAARPRDAGELAKKMGAYLAALEDKARAAHVEAAEERVRLAEAKRKQKLTMALAAAVLLLAVGAWWVNQQGAARAAKLREQFQAAVLEAGRAEEPEQALSAAKRARDLSEQADADMPPAAIADLERIEADAQAALDGVRIERENRELMARLEQVRGPGVEDARFSVDWETMERGYAEAFRKVGLDPDAGSVDDAVAALQGRGDDHAFAAALDDWTAIRREMKATDGAKRLANVASTLDQDRMRGTLRAALLSDDAGTLMKLAQEVDVTKEDPRTLHRLGLALRYLGRAAESHELFLRAHDAYPGHHMLAHDLARSMYTVSVTGMGDLMRPALRYYLVARALRPDSYVINVELGQQYINAKEFERAEKLFRDMIAKRPTDAVLAGELGLVFEFSGRSKEAEAQMQAALRLDPGAVWVRQMWANMLLTRGRVDEAVRELEEVIRLNPKVAQAHAGLGNALNRRGDRPGALAAFRRAAELDPAGTGPRVRIMDTLREMGKHDEAAQACAEAVAAFPRSIAMCSAAGWCCIRMGRNDEALAHARKGLALAAEVRRATPSTVGDLHTLVGVVLGAQGKVDEAIEAYRKAVAVQPDVALRYENMGRFCHMNGRLEAAREAFERALEIEPKRLNSLTLLGFVHQQAGRPDKAIEYFRRAVKVDPKHAAALAGIAEAHMAAGRQEQAVASAREFVAAAPDAGMAYYTLARALTGLGEYEEALTVVRRAAGGVPAWQIRYFVADVNVRQGKYREATSGFSFVLRFQAKDLQVHGKLVDAWQNAGEPERALEAARAAVKAVPDQGPGHFMEGNVLTLLRRYDEARAAYERGLAADPGQTNLRVALANLLAMTGKPEEALEKMRAIVKAKPEAAGYNTLAWSLVTYPGAEQRKPQEALALARNAAEMNPMLPPKTLAAALYRAGRHAEAETAFAKALDDGVDQHACGAYLRAMNLRKLGREADAKKWFEEAERRIATEGEYPWADHRWLRGEAKRVFGERK